MKDSVTKFQPRFVTLVRAVKCRYKVAAIFSDDMHLSFSFQRLFDGSGYATRKEAYAAAKKELEEKGYGNWAFLLKLDLGKEAEAE